MILESWQTIEAAFLSWGGSRNGYSQRLTREVRFGIIAGRASVDDRKTLRFNWRRGIQRREFQGCQRSCDLPCGKLAAQTVSLK